MMRSVPQLTVLLVRPVPSTPKAVRTVAYYRVSAARQDRFEPGPDAQRETVERFAAARGWTLIDAFTKVESGKASARPELAHATRRCRLTGATLVVAKLDRLSRDLEFLAALGKGAVPFVAADLPEANTLTLGVMASMAQHEREVIAERTRAGLAAAKAREVVLGNPRLEATRPSDTREATAARSTRGAAARYADLAVVVDALETEAGRRLSLRELVERLTEAGCTSPRGGPLTTTHVGRLRQAVAAAAARGPVILDKLDRRHDARG